MNFNNKLSLAFGIMEAYTGKWPPVKLPDAKKDAGVSGDDLDFLLSLPFEVKKIGGGVTLPEINLTFFLNGDEIDTQICVVADGFGIRKAELRPFGMKRTPFPDPRKLHEWLKSKGLV